MPAAGTAVPKKLFRQLPPRELVEEILRLLGFRAGMADLRCFTAGELQLESQEIWLPQLEPYYLPCKARRFFEGRGPLDGPRCIAVLRHILRPHGYDLHVQERMYKDAKATLYQMQPVNPFQALEGADTGVVDFS
jgi:hypothetical protein